MPPGPDMARQTPSRPVHLAKAQALKAAASSCLTWMKRIWLDADDADVMIALLFADREPVGRYRVEFPARCETDYASLIEAEVPIVVQHTRFNSIPRSSCSLPSV